MTRPGDICASQNTIVKSLVADDEVKAKLGHLTKKFRSLHICIERTISSSCHCELPIHVRCLSECMNGESLSSRLLQWQNIHQRPVCLP